MLNSSFVTSKNEMDISRNGLNNYSNNINNINLNLNSPYGEKPMFNNNPNVQSRNNFISFNDIPNDIIIKTILFYSPSLIYRIQRRKRLI